MKVELKKIIKNKNDALLNKNHENPIIKEYCSWILKGYLDPLELGTSAMNG